VISRFSGASLCSPFSGDRGVHYAESTIGTFRTRVAGRRVVLALNDVAISTCRDPARAKAQAKRLAKGPAVADPEPGPVNAAYALRAATVAGARAIGLSNAIGAIKPGMMADLIILNLNEPAFVPFNSAPRQIVFSESGRGVETVLVGGRRVVRGGKLVTLDEGALAAAVEKVAPAFRRDAQALAARNADLVAPLLSASRKAWKVPLGFERYMGHGSS
jgi:5-methylthioadenosine/S-adenosylhomocysteine deaminase